MSKYPFVDRLSVEDLQKLQQAITLNPDFIREQISKRGTDSISNNTKDYAVRSIVTSTDEINHRSLEVLDNIKLSELDFLLSSFTEAGNNRDKLIIPFDFILRNKEGNNIATQWKLRDFVDYGKLSQENQATFNDIDIIKEILEKSSYVSYLEEFFKNDEFIEIFPGILNTYNYIKRRLFDAVNNSVSSDPIEIRNSLFNSQDIKVEIVKENFQDIAKELLFERDSIPKKKFPRISVSNSILVQAARNQRTVPTKKEQLLINAIAFGTTLEKLENKNYSDAKNLIYVKR